MKVTIQDNTTEFIKDNNQFVIPNGASINRLALNSSTLLLQTPSQTIQVRCLAVDKIAKTVTLLYNNQKYIAKITEPMDELLKSMGLENAIKSPTAGTIASIHVSKGQAVDKNFVLIRFE
jgi:acetyl/propionyl-CoA carboxylase alpha subunit